MRKLKENQGSQNGIPVMIVMPIYNQIVKEAENRGMYVYRLVRKLLELGLVELRKKDKIT